MKKANSKGIFAAALGQIATVDDVSAAGKHSVSSPHLRKVAAGVRELQERSELANRLLSDSERIIELDPDAIVPSPIPDRFVSAYSDDALREIVESMRQRGQIVPGMVRPHGAPGNFQIVYGRRRLAAAKLLGCKFKTVVRELSDEQAVILQGEENAERADLTFIEKCAFALAQETSGFRRDVICSSLSTAKSHVSEMIKIASAIPTDVLNVIGPAPTVGRGRWLAFSETLGRENTLNDVREICTDKSIAKLDSDGRFNLIFGSLATGRSEKKTSKVTGHSRVWKAVNGRLAFSARSGPKGVVLELAKSDADEFGNWFLENAERLYADFLETNSKMETGD